MLTFATTKRGNAITLINKFKNNMSKETYNECELHLTGSGFSKECGMPLVGVRFSSSIKYAIVLRTGDNKYEIFYFDK